MSDQSVEVHFFQNVVSRKLLASLILVQSCQHSASLLACDWEFQIELSKDFYLNTNLFKWLMTKLKELKNNFSLSDHDENNPYNPSNNLKCAVCYLFHVLKCWIGPIGENTLNDLLRQGWCRSWHFWAPSFSRPREWWACTRARCNGRPPRWTCACNLKLAPGRLCSKSVRKWYQCDFEPLCASNGDDNYDNLVNSWTETTT